MGAVDEKVLNRERNSRVMAGSFGVSVSVGSLCSPFGRRGNDRPT
jgi:hypothetical protein